MNIKHSIQRLLAVCTLCASAQQTLSFTDSDTDWDTFLSEYTADEERPDEDNDTWLLQLEELKLLHEQPLNINTATVEEFRQIPFLTDEQIEQIHAYIYLHGQMQTLGELRLVPLMDDRTMQWLHLFAYAQEAKADKEARPFAHLRQELSSRLDIPLYYRKGYMTSNGYAGDPLYQRIRYEIGNKRHFRAGVRVEKDAGERFYDSYGAFAQLRNIGILHNAVIGDYRIGFGEGLVVGGSSWYSKSTPTRNRQQGARPMTGMDETNFLRGAAATLSLLPNSSSSLSLTVFASHRQQDATLNKDGSVKTIVAGGYHRTQTEREKKNNLASTVAGANMSWEHHGLHLGATGYWQHFSLPLCPGTEAYRTYYPSGTDMGALGLNYGYSRYRFTFAGETAYSTSHSGLGTLHRVTWIASKRYTLSAIQRYYAKNYRSLLSGAFAEGSNAQNENGVMLHLSAQPVDGWQFVTYVDFFYHPFPRYHINHSSQGQEAMLQVTHPIGSYHSLMARYQFKRKETASAMEPHHRLKAQWIYTPSKAFKLQTTAQLHSVLGSKGWSVQTQAASPLFGERLGTKLSIAYFHTPDYLSRIYLYEPSLFGSISSAQYYGRGVHAVATCRWTSRSGRWMLEGKYSMLRYMDRSEQGSAMQTIFSPWKNDISVQLRIRI